MKKESQHKKILHYLQNHEWISPMEAWNILHITKLSTRVGELIDNGYEFEKEWVGNHEYMKYRLITEEEGERS